MTSREKCMCGSYAELKHITEVGRLIDKYIEVTNVPIHICVDCGDSFMTGSDSLKFARLVDEGVNKGFRQIDFNSTL